MKRRALVTGATGQDGSYMVEHLLTKDYTVYALVRRNSRATLGRLQGLERDVEIILGDLLDTSSLRHAMKLADPDEIYHFASQSHVGLSFTEPLHTAEVTGLGAVRVFETALHHCRPGVRVYQASSSEQYGNPSESPQTELTPFRPISPYGCAKTYAHHMAHLYRQASRLFIACGIAYNHESPRRGEDFVTRKITKAVAAIKSGTQQTLTLGTLSAMRDWSHAKDIVHGAWLSLQAPEPKDYIFASGRSWSVEEFAQAAFNVVGLKASDYVISDPALFRPTEVSRLCGDSGRAQQQLGWKPQVTFQQLVEEMVHHDLDLIKALRPHSEPVAP